MPATDSFDPPSHRSEPADRMFPVLIAGLLLCSGWLIATPFVPAVSRCLLNRFHLRTVSFWTWAVQQPIPAMYSGLNTTEVRNLPLDAGQSGLLDPLLLDPLFGGTMPMENTNSASGRPIGVIGGRTINHFPVREITFANSRAFYLSDRQTKWFVLETTYRSQQLRSVYELRREESGKWSMIRVEEP